MSSVKRSSRRSPYLGVKKRIKSIRHLSGVALPLVVVTHIEAFRSLGMAMPVPFLLLYMSVVFSANLNLAGGMASAGIASLFVVWASHLGFGPPTLTGGPLQVMLGVVLFSGTAFAIGITKRKSVMYLAELAKHQQELQQRVEARTVELTESNLHLEQARRKFFDFAKASADTFWELDRDLIFRSVEHPGAALELWPDELLLSKHFGDPSLRFVDSAGGNAALQSLEGHQPFRGIELEVASEDGQTKWLAASATPLFDFDGNFDGYRGVFSDITARRSLEEKVRQAERLDTIGRFTQGISHDFNNLLAIIQGNAELVASEVRNTDFEAPVRDIVDASARGSALVGRLAAFGSTGKSSPEHVNVADRLRGLARLLESALGSGIDLKLLLDDGSVNVYCDALQFDNAILNLTINARDAMESAGCVTIHTRRHNSSDDGELQGLPPGDYVCVAIDDTGKGVSSDVLKQMFEPFFTTKAGEGGSGIGLSIVQKFVDQSGGQFTARSTPGKGTIISLYLPQSDPVPGSVGKQAEQSEFALGPDSSGVRILLVEDNEPLLGATASNLRKAGYEIREATTAAEALEIVRSSQSFDVLFTDIALPGGMSGADLAVQLSSEMPNLPIIFTSGQVRTIEVDGSPQPVLPKPYSVHDLLERIRTTLLKASRLP